ncbi:MAG TPA: hypothetical protein PLD27_03635 [bacterium]|nr:hypothetical protein [bacterium]HOL47855.1 hypothetical protein [bacterium]HPQ17894.1 hypothetical protein [bacterium]
MRNGEIPFDESLKKLLQLAEKFPQYFIKQEKIIEAGVKKYFEKTEKIKKEEEFPLKVQYNSLEIIYFFLKSKYTNKFLPGRIEELLEELKKLSETEKKEEFRKLKERIILLLKNIEAQILTMDKNYKPKFLTEDDTK